MSTSIRRFWPESCRWTLLVLLAPLPFSTPPAADVAVGDIIRGPVTQVTTGRTLVIAGNVVTLWGIAVPEPGQRCSSADRVEYDCGEHVRFALRLLTAGTAITCLIKGIDRQRTIWAQCEREGAELGSVLVVTGRAVDDAERSAGRYAGDESAALAQLRFLGRRFRNIQGRWGE